MARHKHKQWLHDFRTVFLNTRWLLQWVLGWDLCWRWQGINHLFTKNRGIHCIWKRVTSLEVWMSVLACSSQLKAYPMKTFKQFQHRECFWNEKESDRPVLYRTSKGVVSTKKWVVSCGSHFVFCFTFPLSTSSTQSVVVRMVFQSNVSKNHNSWHLKQCGKSKLCC